MTMTVITRRRRRRPRRGLNDDDDAIHQPSIKNMQFRCDPQ